MDHLLYSRATGIDSEPDFDDVPDLELTTATAGPDVYTPTMRFDSKSTTMPVAV